MSHQPDWDRLSRRVDRNYHRDQLKTEVRMRGDTAQAPKRAVNTPQVTTHQIGIFDASSKPVSSSEGHTSERAAIVSAELATLTARIERGWAIMGGFDCPNIQPDTDRIERLTATWEELNTEAARLAREFIALTGRMWHGAT